MIHVKLVDASSSAATTATATATAVNGDSKLVFGQDYNLLTRERGWIVKSDKNRSKVKLFKLEAKRSCTLEVYPNGKAIIALECSYRPFKLYEEDGSREFFEVIGKISLILSQEFMQHSIIPPTRQWLLKQYDRDVTIPELALSEKYPSIRNWYSKEGIQLRALGRTFQIHDKIMLICGRCLRVEEKVGIQEDVSLEQGIKDALIEQPFEISSAFDMLKDNKKNQDDNDDHANKEITNKDSDDISIYYSLLLQAVIDNLIRNVIVVSVTIWYV